MPPAIDPERLYGSWSKGRVLACAVGSVLAPFVTLALMRLVTAQVVDEGPRTAQAAAGSATAPAATTAAPTSRASVAPAAAAVSAAPAVTPAEVPTTAATIEEGLDASQWRSMLRRSVESSSWKRAGEAVMALGHLDPAALSQPDLLAAATSTAMALELADQESAKQMFEAMAQNQGGIDVLYQIAAQRRGSKAALRADELLSKPEVRAKASPGLRVAMALREAPCSGKAALLDRVEEEGDHRSLLVLVALRAADCDPNVLGCCLPNDEKIEHVVRTLSARARQAAGAPR